mgnify:CR=1 FL=1
MILIYLVTLPQGVVTAQGAAFSAIVILEMVILFVIRSGYRVAFFSNKWLVLSVLLTIFLQGMIMYMPFFRELFTIGFITPLTWLLIVIAGVWFSLVHAVSKQNKYLS